MLYLNYIVYVFFVLFMNVISSVKSSVNYSKKAIKNHHGEVPVVLQSKIKNLQYKQQIIKKIKIHKEKTTTKQNFEPSTMYLCLGACTTVRVRYTGRLQCKMTQEMV